MTVPSSTLIFTGAAVGFLMAQGEKSQTVRLFDVLALGPYMIALGTRGTLGERERQFLQFAGAATMGYNARNMLANL